MPVVSEVCLLLRSASVALSDGSSSTTHLPCNKGNYKHSRESGFEWPPGSGDQFTISLGPFFEELVLETTTPVMVPFMIKLNIFPRHFIHIHPAKQRTSFMLHEHTSKLLPRLINNLRPSQPPDY